MEEGVGNVSEAVVVFDKACVVVLGSEIVSVSVRTTETLSDGFVSVWEMEADFSEEADFVFDELLSGVSDSEFVLENVLFKVREKVCVRVWTSVLEKEED